MEGAAAYCRNNTNKVQFERWVQILWYSERRWWWCTLQARDNLKQHLLGRLYNIFNYNYCITSLFLRCTEFSYVFFACKHNILWLCLSTRFYTRHLHFYNTVNLLYCRRALIYTGVFYIILYDISFFYENVMSRVNFYLYFFILSLFNSWSSLSKKNARCTFLSCKFALWICGRHSMAKDA